MVLKLTNGTSLPHGIKQIKSCQIPLRIMGSEGTRTPEPVQQLTAAEGWRTNINLCLPQSVVYWHHMPIIAMPELNCIML